MEFHRLTICPEGRRCPDDGWDVDLIALRAMFGSYSLNACLLFHVPARSTCLSCAFSPFHRRP
jgi:hypothetical protein